MAYIETVRNVMKYECSDESQHTEMYDALNFCSRSKQCDVLTWHMRGPPESPRHASRPPRSNPAQNMLSVTRYSGRKRVRLRHSAVEMIGSCTSCRVSAEM